VERWAQDAVRVSRAVLDQMLATCMETSFVPRLGAIQSPALVVGGPDDATFSSNCYVRLSSTGCRRPAWGCWTGTMTGHSSARSSWRGRSRLPGAAGAPWQPPAEIKLTGDRSCKPGACVRGACMARAGCASPRRHTGHKSRAGQLGSRPRMAHRPSVQELNKSGGSHDHGAHTLPTHRRRPHHTWTATHLSPDSASNLRGSLSAAGGGDPGPGHHHAGSRTAYRTPFRPADDLRRDLGQRTTC
jgi:hypothetical protein